jgi:beta-glucuronidase
VTVPENLIRADLACIKETGANFVRVHYPIDPVVLNLADEIGLLVMEEPAFCWWKPSSTAAAVTEAIVSAAKRALRGMIRRDRNHPCIVFWSMANECETDCPVGIAAMREMMALARELDPTRLATFVVAGDAGAHEAFSDADLVAVNVYFGLFHSEIAPHIRDFDRLVKEPTGDHLRAAAAQYPGKPIVVTEFGTQGIRGLRGDARFTEDYQAAYIGAVWRAIEDVPEVSGGVHWCWADYYHRRDFIGRGGRMIHSVYGPYGAVTVDRQAKPALQTLAGLYGGGSGGATDAER